MNDKEYKIIDIISKNNKISQREISSRVGFSIGMVNIILHNLMTNGYIKIMQLNKKKVAYMLTRRGFREKAKKSYRYMKNLIHDINDVKEQIKYFLQKKYSEGYRVFQLKGDGDIAVLVELSLNELALKDARILKTNISEIKENTIVINCGNDLFTETGVLNISEII